MPSTIEIVGLDPAAGWAFVKQGEKCFLVRPPYTENNFQECTAMVIENAVMKHNFIASSHTVAGWPELFDYLRGHIAREWVARDAARSLSVTSRLLRYASRDTVNRLLDRIERELLPEREFLAARLLLQVFGDLEEVKYDPALRLRVATLNAVCLSSQAG